MISGALHSFTWFTCYLSALFICIFVLLQRIMPARTNKKSYQRHEYSGPRKSRKKVLASLKRYTDLARNAFWRGQVKPNIGTDNDPNTTVLSKPLKTYSRAKQIRIEAPSTQAPEPTTSAVEVESDKEPLQINWPQPDPHIDSVKLNIEASTDNGLSGISGYRTVELRHVIEWSFKMERHRSVCESSQIEFVSENHNGFQSNLMFKCSMCDKTWKHSTESTDKVNTSFVWGTVTAGSYYTQAAHITSLMDIPTMSAVTFRRTENKLGKVWREHLTEEIKKAGEEERSIALEKGGVS
ncbi:hypothetical protein ABMA27_014743 [Loxostege sticticalis]|uniref:Mutator-like transposase domain-containing protein n=1 Tax=Loxostege sticticalis TaxID=481309 RepID=A0ABR3IA34_LOXSC